MVRDAPARRVRFAARVRSAALAALASLAALATPSRARADEPLVFVADPQLAMEGGVRTFDSAGRVVFRYEEALPTVVRLDETRPLEHAGAVLGRVAKLVFLDEPLAELDGAWIHEVVGHGARAREAGGAATYTLRLPGVWCLVLSPTSQSCRSSTEGTISVEQGDTALLVTAAGIEANALTSWWIDERMVAQDGWLHHGDLLLYFGKLVYAPSVLSRDLDTAGKLPGGFDDVDHYVSLLQDRYNRVGAGDRASIAGRLRAGYLWNFADPMLVFAAYGTAMNLWSGDRRLRFPLPRAFGVTFYPTPRWVPSPYGGESYLDVFLARAGGGAVLDVYGRTATSGLAHAWGAGARAFGVRVHERVTAGAELDVFRQPETLLDVHAAYDRAQVWGMNAGVSTDVRLWGALGGTARLAWKSRGWLTGAPIDAGAHGWAGASIAW